MSELERPGLATATLCPNCRSADITRDSASPWIFLWAGVLFPLGLFFFFFNHNVYCGSCGVRFRR